MERRFYKVVSANSSESDDYVIANGVKLELDRVGGNASSTPDTSVAIYWDTAGANELVFCTHGDSEQRVLSKSFTGDGVKILRIKLINDQAETDTLGGYWIGDLV